MQDDKGEKVANDIGGAYARADVANPEQVIAAVEAAKDLGPLKALVNCAGIGWATRTVGKDGSYDSAHDLDVFRKVDRGQPDRHVQLHPPGGHGDEPERAQRATASEARS